MLKCGLDWRIWAKTTFSYADIKQNNDHQGGRGSVERIVVERLLRGEKPSAERFFKERLSPWREQPRRERLHGGTLSVEKPLQGEIIFKERISLWRDSLRGETSPRRDNLRGEDISVERLFEEREATGRTRPAFNLQRSVDSFTSLSYSVGLLP
jgi:hypothetical protein